MGSNPQGELEDEDDMLTQQRKNFEAEKAKGDGEMVRTTFFDYDFSQQNKNNATKKQKSKNKKKAAAADKPKNNHKSNFSSEISTTNNTITNVDHPVTSSNSASNSSSTSYSWKRLFKCCDSSPTKRHQNNHITEVSICRRVTVTGVCPLKQLLTRYTFVHKFWYTQIGVHTFMSLSVRDLLC